MGILVLRHSYFDTRCIRVCPFPYAHGYRAHAKLPMTATATSLELGSKDHMRDSRIARNLIITTAIVDHVCNSSATCAIWQLYAQFNKCTLNRMHDLMTASANSQPNVRFYNCPCNSKTARAIRQSQAQFDELKDMCNRKSSQGSQVLLFLIVLLHFP